jgi:hypothetical protein
MTGLKVRWDVGKYLKRHTRRLMLECRKLTDDQGKKEVTKGKELSERHGNTGLGVGMKGHVYSHRVKLNSLHTYSRETIGFGPE